MRRALPAIVCALAACGDRTGLLVSAGSTSTTLAPTPPPAIVSHPGAPWAPWPMLGQDASHRARAASTPPANQRLQWSLDAHAMYPDDADFSPPVVGTDGTIYAVANRSLVAVDPAGKTKWTTADVIVVPSAPAIGPSGAIYVETTAGLRAYEPSGAILWTAVLWGPLGEERLISSPGGQGPVVVADGTIYVAGVYYVHAISPAGNVEWSVSRNRGSDQNINTYDFSPAVRTDGIIEVVANPVGTWVLMAITPNGAIAWEQPLPLQPMSRPASSPAIADDGTSYVMIAASARTDAAQPETEDLYLQAFAPDGTPTWRAPAGRWPPGGALPAIGVDGTVYLAEPTSTSATLAAFAPGGAAVWSVLVPIAPLAPLSLTQPAIGTDGAIDIVGTGVALAAPNGTIAPGGYPSTNALYGQAVGADGTIYVREAPDRLVALGK